MVKVTKDSKVTASKIGGGTKSSGAGGGKISPDWDVKYQSDIKSSV